MKFWTFARQYGNSLIVRGWDDAKGGWFKDRVPFKPTLFLPSKKETGFKTLDGKDVAPIQPGSIRDCKEFLEKYEGVSGTQVYGFERFLYQYLSEEYPGEVEYDTDKIKLWSLDIETASENGFPKPDLAEEEVLLITLKNFRSKKLITFGSRPYNKTREDVEYIQCKDEIDLLITFVEWWASVEPDVITGWNVDGFDIPFLCNRIRKIGGEKLLNRLSPWAFVKYTLKNNQFGQQVQKYDIAGVSVIDYLDLYKKFTYTNRESYRLDVIADIELGRKKLDHSEFETFKDFYTNGWDKFVDYNLVDVDLVDELEEKMKLIDLVMLMAYDAKCNFVDTFAQVRLWDIIIYNYLKKQNIVLPLLSSNEKPDQFVGAYVKEPVPAGYDWVVSFDLNSLYPSLIRFLNVSPETLINGDPLEVNHIKLIDKTETVEPPGDYAVAANGAMYSKEKRGMMSELVIKMYEERVGYKKRMLKYKQLLVDIEVEMKKRKLL